MEFLKLENETTTKYIPIFDTPDSTVDNVYPVGSIYLTVNDVNPSTLFGGVWEKIEDKFLIGKSSNYSQGGGK